jgi:hypothetical protein
MRHFSSRPISSTGSFLGVMSQLRNGICPPDLFKFMRGHRSILFSNSCITAFDEIFPARACVIDIYRKIESCLVPTSLFHHPFVVTMLHNTFSNWEIGFFCGKIGESLDDVRHWHEVPARHENQQLFVANSPQNIQICLCLWAVS